MYGSGVWRVCHLNLPIPKPSYFVWNAWNAAIRKESHSYFEYILNFFNFLLQCFTCNYRWKPGRSISYSDTICACTVTNRTSPMNNQRMDVSRVFSILSLRSTSTDPVFHRTPVISSSSVAHQIQQRVRGKVLLSCVCISEGLYQI